MVDLNYISQSPTLNPASLICRGSAVQFSRHLWRAFYGSGMELGAEVLTGAPISLGEGVVLTLVFGPEPPSRTPHPHVSLTTP